jgi:hypothetical protein
MRRDVDWSDPEARVRAERTARFVAALGDEYADLYRRSAWVVAIERARTRAYAGSDDLSELGRAAERLCTLLHNLAHEGEKDTPATIHLVRREAEG